MACEYINPTPISQLECDEPWLMNEIMELSVESSNVFRPAIIKIYDPKEILSTDGSLPFHTGGGISKLQLEKVKGAIEANERNDRLTCRGRAIYIRIKTEIDLLAMRELIKQLSIIRLMLS